jgi:hypothetical protein
MNTSDRPVNLTLEQLQALRDLLLRAGVTTDQAAASQYLVTMLKKAENEVPPLAMVLAKVEKEIHSLETAVLAAYINAASTQT